MLGWLRKALGSQPPQPATQKLRAERLVKLARLMGAYDAARTTDYNVRHWANADTLSADADNSTEVRRTLRSRAGYEAQESNSYAKGIVLTLANDTIGTGPKLQILTPNRQANRLIEAVFSRRARDVSLAEKLRTMRIAKVIDGEAFAPFCHERAALVRQPDLRLIEADQIVTAVPDYPQRSDYAIRFD